MSDAGLASVRAAIGTSREQTTRGSSAAGRYECSGKEGEGVLVGSASRSKRLARAVAVCARGSMRVSELTAVEDALARLTGDNLEHPRK